MVWRKQQQWGGGGGGIELLVQISPLHAPPPPPPLNGTWDTMWEIWRLRLHTQSVVLLQVSRLVDLQAQSFEKFELRGKFHSIYVMHKLTDFSKFVPLLKFSRVWKFAVFFIFLVEIFITSHFTTGIRLYLLANSPSICSCRSTGQLQRSIKTKCLHINVSSLKSTADLFCSNEGYLQVLRCLDLQTTHAAVSALPTRQVYLRKLHAWPFSCRQQWSLGNSKWTVWTFPACRTAGKG